MTCHFVRATVISTTSRSWSGFEEPSAVLISQDALKHGSCPSWLSNRFTSRFNPWSPVTTVTNLTGTLEFTDPDAVNSVRRFYRTVLK